MTLMPKSRCTKRSPGRRCYLVMVFVVVVLGLLARKWAAYLPEIINLYLGDALWALMVYLLIRAVFVDWKAGKTAIAGLVFCLLIELSQLYQAPWINSIRQTTLGALVLGFGFLWSDLLAYTLGIVAGVIIDYKITSATKKAFW